MTTEFVSRCKNMLRKIDCVMIRVGHVQAAAEYYAKVFGLRPRRSGDGSIGLGFPETDAEVVLHSDPKIPPPVEVYYLVQDVIAVVDRLLAEGCHVLVAHSMSRSANAPQSVIHSVREFAFLI